LRGGKDPITRQGLADPTISGCVASSMMHPLPGHVSDVVGDAAPGAWCIFADSTHPDMVVVAGPVSTGT
jgi:hypothetical protein